MQRGAAIVTARGACTAKLHAPAAVAAPIPARRGVQAADERRRMSRAQVFGVFAQPFQRNDDKKEEKKEAAAAPAAEAK